ncbi:winged helix-turn-helix domain-containing protein [Actinomadura sp. ATCC 31491]|uniref:Winged helix-turn-helix domain-containing protein n=1 Tax=Actinomadura luzonensis TaxID=2805427 RepID=A0ABT0G732_9ACTN|nr:transcriptional regulator [Actinomadura luzonensis]MCK2220387.1 winged helix-turn-helix domain-containing protein [Actinomadura luzonensis]
MSTAPTSRLHCSILGPLQVRVDGHDAVIGAPKQRLLLALLLCRANAVVPAADLIDALWGETPPRTARKNLQVYVSALRKVAGDRIGFHGWGYRFRAGPAELDLLRLRELARTGRSAIHGGNPAAAAELLGDAVALWRDQPLTEFAHVPQVVREVARITDLFLSAYEDWAELELGLGHHVEALTSLDALPARFRTRERIAAARMTALARCGRASEALSYFEELRRYLATVLGIDPSPVLKRLYQDILTGAVARSAPPGARGGGAPVPVLANQLPRDIGDFVGRTAELGRVMAGPAPVVLITGEPGIGKTALAVHAAHTLAPAYPDGALMIPLRRGGGGPHDVRGLQHELLEAVGVSTAGMRDQDVLASVWRSWLARRRVLLVLDDAPDEPSVRLLLPGCGDSRVLVTSRSRLSGLESVARIELGELTAAESVEFLARQVGRERALAGRAALTALFGRYGRSPLMLRLLGGRLARLPHVPLGLLIDRLTRAERVLDEFAAGDVSLRERFEEFYDRPSWPHRAAFVALGALHGPPFGHEELVAALDGPGTPAERVIESLLEANVLSVPGPGAAEVTAHSLTYTMSPLAHLFAAELHRADG